MLLNAVAYSRESKLNDRPSHFKSDFDASRSAWRDTEFHRHGPEGFAHAVGSGCHGVRMDGDPMLD